MKKISKALADKVKPEDVLIENGALTGIRHKTLTDKQAYQMTEKQVYKFMAATWEVISVNEIKTKEQFLTQCGMTMVAEVVAMIYNVRFNAKRKGIDMLYAKDKDGKMVKIETMIKRIMKERKDKAYWSEGSG